MTSADAGPRAVLSGEIQRRTGGAAPSVSARPSSRESMRDDGADGLRGHRAALAQRPLGHAAEPVVDEEREAGDDDGQGAPAATRAGRARASTDQPTSDEHDGRDGGEEQQHVADERDRAPRHARPTARPPRAARSRPRRPRPCRRPAPRGARGRPAGPASRSATTHRADEAGEQRQAARRGAQQAPPVDGQPQPPGRLGAARADRAQPAGERQQHPGERHEDHDDERGQAQRDRRLDVRRGRQRDAHGLRGAERDADADRDADDGVVHARRAASRCSRRRARWPPAT